MQTLIMAEEYTTQEVADMLRIHRLSVIRRIESGKLRARKEGSEWRIRKSDLDAYIKSTFPDLPHNGEQQIE
jgi:excisionase family DNA binding protein